MTLPQTPFGETFRFPVWGDDLSGDLGLHPGRSPPRRVWT
jgi:hypothetical protein